MLSKHSAEVTINKGLKQSTTVSVIFKKIMFVVTAGFKQKYLETSFKNLGLNLTNFHQIIGHEVIQNNVYNLL